VEDQGSAIRKGHLRFLNGGGEMGQRIRAFNWNVTPLGPPQKWPQALKTLVNLLLVSKQPMFLGWGPERTFGTQPSLGLRTTEHAGLGGGA
jgi:hypothetical protein